MDTAEDDQDLALRQVLPQLFIIDLDFLSHIVHADLLVPCKEM